MVLFSAYEADEPEGSKRPKSDMASPKFVALLAGIAVIVIVAAQPAIRQLRDEKFKTDCKSRLGSLSQSLQQYAIDHDGYLPPVYQMVPGTSLAVQDPEGRAIGWPVTVIEYSKSAAIMKCPAAEPVDQAQSQSGVQSTYGMYLPMGMAALANLSDPSGSILLAETANNGANGSFDPKPLMGENGKPISDNGFVIGFDSGNSMDPEVLRDANSVTRLAFRNVGNGQFSDSGKTRHGSSVFAILADGSLTTLKAPQSLVQHRVANSTELMAPWKSR